MWTNQLQMITFIIQVDSQNLLLKHEKSGSTWRTITNPLASPLFLFNPQALTKKSATRKEVAA